MIFDFSWQLKMSDCVLWSQSSPHNRTKVDVYVQDKCSRPSSDDAPLQNFDTWICTTKISSSKNAE